MRIRGLAPNDPTREQYQLWVVESSRGTPLEVPPVDGGVFNVDSSGRTVIPVRSLRGRLRRLAHLGTRPLGAVLFADPSTVRGRMEVARFDIRHALYQAACAHSEAPPPELWGRRTLFRYQDKPLLVNEVFLHDIPDFIA